MLADVAVEQFREVFWISDESLVAGIQFSSRLRPQCIDARLSGIVAMPGSTWSDCVDGALHDVRHCRRADDAQRIDNVGSEFSATVRKVLLKATVVHLSLKLPDGPKYPFRPRQCVMIKTPKSGLRTLSELDETTIHFILIDRHQAPFIVLVRAR